MPTLHAARYIKARPLLAKHSSGGIQWWRSADTGHIQNPSLDTRRQACISPLACGSCKKQRLRENIGQYLRRSRRISTLRLVRFLRGGNGEQMLEGWGKGRGSQGETRRRTFGEVAPLDHEVLHHSVKGGSFVAQLLACGFAASPFTCKRRHHHWATAARSSKSNWGCYGNWLTVD